MEPSAPPATPRRVFTAPALHTPRQARSPSQTTDAVVETLYNHAHIKIVSFTAGPRPFPIGPSSELAPLADPEPGTLDWSSQLERTIAVGPFRIYRAPGSVAFLSCGSALQPILPKSQCWCIDEASSKFVLQIRRPQFWRIEVPPGEAEESGSQALLLRQVFGQILQFEKTPCPFKRAFTVQLPERPQTPIRKRPWTPIRRSVAELPPTPVTPVHVASRLPAAEQEEELALSSKLEAEHELYASLEGDATLEAIPSSVDQVDSNESPSRDDTTHDGSATHDRSPSPDIILPALPGPFAGFQTGRSVTAPPQLTLHISPPSKSATRVVPDGSTEEAEKATPSASPTESSDSFHSIQSWHSPITPLPPSPPISTPSSPITFPYPHDNIVLPKPLLSHHRDVSDATITPVAHRAWMTSPTGADMVSLESSSDTSSVYEDPAQQPAATTSRAAGHSSSSSSTSQDASGVDASPATTTAVQPPQARIRHRATTSSMSMSSHRALSPLPPAANLFTPHRRHPRYNSTSRATTRLEAVQRIPGAIIHKTCEILMAPPGHLLALMLKVAARIAAGEWRGLVFGTGDAGESIPVQWDYSDDNDPNSWGVGGGGGEYHSGPPWPRRRRPRAPSPLRPGRRRRTARRGGARRWRRRRGRRQ